MNALALVFRFPKQGSNTKYSKGLIEGYFVCGGGGAKIASLEVQGKISWRKWPNYLNFLEKVCVVSSLETIFARTDFQNLTRRYTNLLYVTYM